MQERDWRYQRYNSKPQIEEVQMQLVKRKGTTRKQWCTSHYLSLNNVLCIIYVYYNEHTKYRTVMTVPKSKSRITERGKIDTLNTNT
jgi:hypothetical protein